MTSVQNKLDKAIDKAKAKIDRLKYLQATDIKSYKEDIEDARNQSEIDQILRDAQEEDRISNEESTKETGEKQALLMNLHSQLRSNHQRMKKIS